MSEKKTKGRREISVPPSPEKDSSLECTETKEGRGPLKEGGGGGGTIIRRTGQITPWRG